MSCEKESVFVKTLLACFTIHIMNCGELVGAEAEMIRRVLDDAVAEAVDHAPSLIILDDLDGLIPGGSEGPEPATTVVALAEFLGDLMDLYQV
jgi:peroxin-1